MFTAMNHDTRVMYYYIGLFVGLPLGILLMILWARKVYKPLVKNLEKNGVYAVAVKTFFYMFPGIIAMIICCIPVLYFGGLYSQEDYCKQVIKVNKGITKDSITLQERCSAFNLDELFEYVQNKNNT